MFVLAPNKSLIIGTFNVSAPPAAGVETLNCQAKIKKILKR